MSRTDDTLDTVEMRAAVSLAEHDLLVHLEHNRSHLLGYGKRHLMKTGVAHAQYVVAGECEPLQLQRRLMLLGAAARLLLAVELMDAGQ
jgi:hypothetical protein